MESISTESLFITLGILIVLSAFFSGSETGMMAINRYRLRHKADSGNIHAKRVLKLLERPDRLIGLILLGNNFINILASSVATIIGLRLFGNSGIAIATGFLTFTILIFAEVTPKTLAALHPERFAFPSSLIIQPLLKLLYPLVWLINILTNSLLRIFGVKIDDNSNGELTPEEFRSVVNETSAIISQKHHKMLVGILDLEKVTVEDIMVPRNEIIGIDIDDHWDDIKRQLRDSQHTRMPIFRESMDNLIGVLHIREAVQLSLDNDSDRGNLIAAADKPYFIPAGTPLNSQLLKFQENKHRIAFAVDEYGDIQGLATLEDILEEVIGEFTTDSSDSINDVQQQDDGSWLVDGSTNVRTLNRLLEWELPMSGAKTVNGMILEYLENIPEAGTSLMIKKHPIEIIKSSDSSIKLVKIEPQVSTKITTGTLGERNTITFSKL